MHSSSLQKKTFSPYEARFFFSLRKIPIENSTKIIDKFIDPFHLTCIQFETWIFGLKINVRHYIISDVIRKQFEKLICRHNIIL